MNRKGYAIPLILLLIVGAIFYFVTLKYSKNPDYFSREITKRFSTYPNSNSWQITNSKKICIYYINKCNESPSVITFSSSDKWVKIYSFYKENLTNEGWITKNEIVTSLPSSIVFGNDTYFKNVFCELIVKPKGRNLSNFLIDPKDTHEFLISVTCDSA